MQDIWVHILRNPYNDTVPESELGNIITEVAKILDGILNEGDFAQDYLALCVMDPTAAPSVSSPEAVMALIVIGEQGHSRLVNAVAKACEHRDHGEDCGKLVYAQLHRLEDGSFLYGFSAEVDGTIVGASSLTELEDRFFAQIFAANFNLRISQIRQKWLDQREERTKWLCNFDAPLEEYADIAGELRAV